MVPEHWVQETAMEFDSHFVGTSIKPYRTKIVWRDTMNYAAAIGDNNPAYFDDE